MRGNAYETFLQSLHTSTPPPLLDIMTSRLQQWVSMHTCPAMPIQPTVPPIVIEAFTSQSVIRWDIFLRGHLSKLWCEAFLAIHTPKSGSNVQKDSLAVQWVTTVVTNIWIYTKTLWSFRNKVVHGEVTLHNTSKEMRQMHQRAHDYHAMIMNNPYCVPSTWLYSLWPFLSNLWGHV